VRKYVAECIGTAVLVLMGCGSAVFLGCETAGGHLAVALAFGLSIVSMAYVIGGLSGCHINPAVSFAMLLSKKMDYTDFVGYVIAQVCGGIIGASILNIILTLSNATDLTGGLGANGFVQVGWLGSLVVELVLSFIFVFTILGVTSDPAKENIAGLVIGLTLTFVHIVGIPLTGTSVNPARSIGPAFFAGAGALSQLWVFIVAPLIGAGLAAFAYQAVSAVRRAAHRAPARTASAS
jgi:aquaporin Z